MGYANYRKDEGGRMTGKGKDEGGRMRDDLIGFLYATLGDNSAFLKLSSD